jgi:hypothetical protein
MGEVVWTLSRSGHVAVHIPVQITGCWVQGREVTYSCMHIPSTCTQLREAESGTYSESDLTAWHKGHSLGPVHKSVAANYHVAQLIHSGELKIEN